MYSGIYVGSEKIKSAYLGSDQIYKSEYTSASVRTMSGVDTQVAYFDYGDYLLVISATGVYKLTKNATSLELIATYTPLSYSEQYYQPVQAWRRNDTELIVMFNKNINSDYGFIFGILNTNTWTYTTLSGAYNSSSGGAYPEGCYMKSEDLVYFWKKETLRTWSPSTNTFKDFDYTLPDHKLFVDVDGKLKGFYWYKTETASVYTVTSKSVTLEYTFDTTKWKDEYTPNNNGFLPNEDGLAYQVTSNNVLEFNLNDRTVKGYPLDTTWPTGNIPTVCTKGGFIAYTVQNSSDIYVITLK